MILPKITHLAALLLGLLAAGAAWWWLQPGKPAVAERALVSLPSLPPPAPLTAPVVIASVATVSPAAAASAAPAPAPAPAVPSHADFAAVPPTKALPTTPAPALIVAAPVPVAASTPAQPKAAMPGASPPSVPVASASPAALQALAQAQGLWSTGAHEAAMDLLREALAAVERAGAGNAQLLAPLARELARMEMAQGRVAQALSLLTRLEPSLSGVAEVWALRGNAAQRLGRHEESAAAYLAALKLRPNEARWMLGAAVSLAAQGQTTSAAELAEKARAGGALSPDVASYLRQLGVPLRER